jgi:hypothetical protein
MRIEALTVRVTFRIRISYKNTLRVQTRTSTRDRRVGPVPELGRVRAQIFGTRRSPPKSKDQ